MDAKPVNGAALYQDSDHPGCMGRLMHLFDFNQALEIQRLLDLRKYTETSEAPGYTIKDANGIFYYSKRKSGEADKALAASYTSKNGTQGKLIGMPMKSLNSSMELEKECKAKSRSPSVVARLMGLDVMPTNNPSLRDLFDGNISHPKLYSSKKANASPSKRLQNVENIGVGCFEKSGESNYRLVGRRKMVEEDCIGHNSDTCHTKLTNIKSSRNISQHPVEEITPFPKQPMEEQLVLKPQFERVYSLSGRGKLGKADCVGHNSETCHTKLAIKSSRNVSRHPVEEMAPFPEKQKEERLLRKQKIERVRNRKLSHTKTQAFTSRNVGREAVTDWEELEESCDSQVDQDEYLSSSYGKRSQMLECPIPTRIVVLKPNIARKLISKPFPSDFSSNGARMGDLEEARMGMRECLQEQCRDGSRDPREIAQEIARKVRERVARDLAKAVPPWRQTGLKTIGNEGVIGFSSTVEAGTDEESFYSFDKSPVSSRKLRMEEKHCLTARLSLPSTPIKSFDSKNMPVDRKGMQNNSDKLAMMSNGERRKGKRTPEQSYVRKRDRAVRDALVVSLQPYSSANVNVQGKVISDFFQNPIESDEETGTPQKTEKNGSESGTLGLLVMEKKLEAMRSRSDSYNSEETFKNTEVILEMEDTSEEAFERGIQPVKKRTGSDAAEVAGTGRENDYFEGLPSTSHRKWSIERPSTLAETSNGNCEQPSPVSVLNSSLFEEDIASPFGFKEISSGLQELRRHICLLKGSDGDVPEEKNATIASRWLPEEEEAIEISNFSPAGDREPGQRLSMLYIQDVLDASGFTDSTSIFSHWCAPSEPLGPHLFKELEDSYLSMQCSESISSRRLLFDCLNEALHEILEPYLSLGHWIKPSKIDARSMPVGATLATMVWTRLSQLLNWRPKLQNYAAQDSIDRYMQVESMDYLEAIFIDLGSSIINDIFTEEILMLI